MNFEYNFDVAGKSDIGRKRNSNQDSILVVESMGLFAVADGMGGHSGGEVASALAVKTVEKIFQEGKGEVSVPLLIKNAVEIANKVIHDQASKKPELQGMGTTLTVAALDEQWVHIAQVGDSRCYLFADDQLFQITEDHSQVYEMLKAGIVTEANLHNLHKNVITRSVGYEPHVQVDVVSRMCKPGDRYLLCSDGLSGMMSNEQIAQVLHNFPINQATQNLVEVANLQGGEDNISVVLFEVK